MAHLTNFSFEFFNEIFTEDASLLLLYHGARKSKMTKNSNLGESCLPHTTSHRQTCTLVMSMVQKAVQSTHCTSCNQQTHKCHTVIAEIFVRVKISFSIASVRELSYAINFRTSRAVSHTPVYAQSFRMLLIFVLTAKSTNLPALPLRFYR